MANKNNVINIQLEESYQDFVIGGEEFRVGLGDESRNKWIEADEKYKETIAKLDKHKEEELEKMSAAEYTEMEKTSKEALKVAFDIMLGDGSFDRLYAKCKDSLKMVQVYNLVADGIIAAIGKQQTDLQKKYQDKMTKAKAK